MFRLAHEKSIPYLLFENVKGLLNHDVGRTFEIILEVLDGLGYDCQWELLDSQNFGVPQHRERIFLIGHLRGKPRPKVFPIGRASRSNDETNSQERKGREGFFSDISQTLDAHYYKGGNARQYVVQTESRRDKEMRTYTEGVVPTLTAQMVTGGGNVPYVRAMLDVARVNKSPNGRLIKDDGDPMYTITAQDRHGVQIGDEDGFAIYPNHTRSSLVVELPKEMKGADYRVLDVTGRVIAEGKGSSNLSILGLDLAGIQPGMYIFEAFDTKRVLHKRFIKQ